MQDFAEYAHNMDKAEHNLWEQLLQDVLQAASLQLVASAAADC